MHSIFMDNVQYANTTVGRTTHDVGALGAVGCRTIHFGGTHDPLAALQRPIITEGDSEGESGFDSRADALLWEMLCR